jgi:RNA polymerase sigma factor (sigma-70 family)
MGDMQLTGIDLPSLLRKDHGALRRRLASILKERSDVDDVFQEAYVRLIEANRKRQQIDNPPAFLHRVCVNLALDRVRVLRRMGRLFVGDSGDKDDDIERLPSASLTPEQQCLSDDFNESVSSLLDELPAKCGRAFVLNKYWNYNYKEIAADMNLSVSMIEKYLRRACQHLQQGLENSHCGLRRISVRPTPRC